MDRVMVDIREWNISKYFNNKDFVTIDELLNKIEDLADDVEYLEEKLQDLKNDVEDNYKPRQNRDIDMYGC